MTNERKSTGISVDPKFFPPSSDIDESVDKTTMNDADESSVTFENERNPIPKARKYQSDTSDSAEYYRMKALGRNTNERPPCKIEFQMVNKNLKQKIRRTSKFNYDHQHCQCHNFSPQPSPTMMPSCTQVTPSKAQNDSNFIGTSSNFDKSKTEGGKSTTIFSCFSPTNADKRDEKIKDKDSEKNEESDEKTEYYHFDHGDFNYFSTTDRAPQLVADKAAQKVHSKATKFWAEFFGSLNVGVTFFMVFFIQLYRFVLYSILRSIVVDFLQTTSDYFIKPLLTVIFNGIIQPILLFFRNIFQSTWNTLEPLAEMVLGFFIPFIEVLRAVRIVDVNINTGVPRYTFNRGNNQESHHESNV